MKRRRAPVAATVLALASQLVAGEAPLVQPEVVVADRFRFSAEGIAITDGGTMYVTADKTLWRVAADGTTAQVADFTRPLGLAALGEDLLVADWGPTNALRDRSEARDGIVWRVRMGERVSVEVYAGIPDPNALLMLPGDRLLVADDFADIVWEVGRGAEPQVFSRAVAYPNSMGLAPDHSALYVAQTFRGLRPVVFDDRVWRVPLAGGRPAGPPEVLFRTGGEGGMDGLAVDARGRVYATGAREGRLWRFDPAHGELRLIAEGLPGLASLAFGRGPWGEGVLYAAQLTGGRVLRFRIAD